MHIAYVVSVSVSEWSHQASLIYNGDFTVWNTIFKLCINPNSIAVSMREQQTLRGQWKHLCRPGLPLTSSWLCSRPFNPTSPEIQMCMCIVLKQAKNQPMECFTCSSCGGQDVVTLILLYSSRLLCLWVRSVEKKNSKTHIRLAQPHVSEQRENQTSNENRGEITCMRS